MHPKRQIGGLMKPVRFRTTHWSVVLLFPRQTQSCPVLNLLAIFAGFPGYPLYVFVRC